MARHCWRVTYYGDRIVTWCEKCGIAWKTESYHGGPRRGATFAVRAGFDLPYQGGLLSRDLDGWLKKHKCVESEVEP